eukprot:1190064-Alexandrium_andersonii.AAC.1
MSASLVGSEMCIRDRWQSLGNQPGRRRPRLGKGPRRGRRCGGPARTADPDTGRPKQPRGPLADQGP